MNNLNSLLLEGNLVRDAELHQVGSSGTSVCKFTVATNRSYKKDNGYEKEVSYFDVQTWGKLAEFSANSGKKGRGCRVVGRLKQDRWEGPDGKKNSKVYIVAEHVEWMPERKDDSNSDHRRENAPQSRYGAPSDDFESDVPF